MAVLAGDDDGDEDDAPSGLDTVGVSAAAGSEVTVSGSLGAQLLLWEVATAVAGRLLGINPFDQPDVESAKDAARTIMASEAGAADDPDAVEGAVEIRALGGRWLPEGTATLEGAVDALLQQVDPQRGYLAVMAYLDRLAHADLADVQTDLVGRTGRPVTFGWGPRFLHSTGQYHKGGPAQGVYLQVTATADEDLPVPGKDFTFGEFIAAQAAGDAKVLAEHDRPVLRLHLTDLTAGLSQLRSVLGR